MLNFKFRDICTSIEVGTRYKFNSQEHAEGKIFSRIFFIDHFNKQEFLLDLSIDPQIIDYKDIASIFKSYKPIQNINEIKFYSKNCNLILKLRQKSIKSFITDRESILEYCNAFENNTRQNLVGFIFDKKANKFMLGSIGNIIDRRGFIGLSRILLQDRFQSHLNITLEKWIQNTVAILSLDTLYNSIGLKLKNNIKNITDFTQIEFATIIEPVKILTIFLWPWIRNIAERNYLLSILKQMAFIVTIAYENNKWNFSFTMVVKDGLRLHIEKDKLSIPYFEMKQIIYC